ncbi:helix-turn-helix transcriptional regulator [Kitasatospora kifunensis]|uniref:DNA-binding NarL/FixJ family response regulator n=1 Tax=Kitasatospora kifunensis TaxID=58351 RepID=A0A7W7R6H7_KITKI|nr:response regulator transcription factor [Kitasatospora kifunensis]MBB4926313.1 DNA-binding NarL/FixJ family response regulator [Kitasatospora kifunensis]
MVVAQLLRGQRQACSDVRTKHPGRTLTKGGVPVPDVMVLTRAADPISRAGLQSYLRTAPGVTLVEDRPPGLRCTVVQLADSVSGELLREARSLTADPKLRLVLIVARLQEAELFDVVGSGVTSILWRHEVTQARLLKAVYNAQSGRSSLPADLFSRLLDQVGRSGRTAGPEADQDQDQAECALSDRETGILRLVADGLDTAEIADTLGYSERWVKNVLHGLTSRLNLRNRSHAVAYALRRGLI